MREAFWDLAARVHYRLLPEGARIFIHCRAGIGRTGMFATAVLMCAGKSFQSALLAVRRAGSNPETERQMEFLQQGPPAGLLEEYCDHDAHE